MKLEMYYLGLCLAVMWLVSWPAVLAQDDPVGSCGVNHHNRQCTDGNCCSNAGYCGSTNEYCCPDHCQSQCFTPTPTPPPGPEDDVSNIITREIFTDMFPYGPTWPTCEGCFYTYDAFITAARVFPAFGATGNPEIRRRELAAFFGQTSHETTGGGGGWDPPGGPYLWGYCFVREIARGDYCVPSQEWPCVPGQQYYGRGPIQLSYNYNYGPAGLYLGVDLLSNPDLVATNATLSFETAIWFWMTPQHDKPSCHDVITGAWTPTQADKDANRLPGYGVLTNIINGGVECGHGPDTRVQDRIGFYKRYSEMFKTTTGNNLDCDNQTPFGSTPNNPYPNSHYGVLKMPIDQA